MTLQCRHPGLRCTLSTLVLAWAVGAQAHDVWIEPSRTDPARAELVDLRLRVGENLAGEALQLVPGLVNRFIVSGPTGNRAIRPQLGADSAGQVRLDAPGLYVALYHSHPSFIELPADKFNPYLLEEGLDSIVALRAARGQNQAAARELYARCAKALLLTGPANPAQSDRRLGCPLELVAQRNPFALPDATDGTLPLTVQLTYLGRPLAGALVVAQNSLAPTVRQARRSDTEGRVSFQIGAGNPSRGMWLIKAVHMVAATDPAQADWMSWWASLTFELPPT